MASAETLPLDALLAPISEAAPAGVNVRLDPDPGSLYYRIKDARSAARAAERQSLHGDDANASLPDWTPVLEFAPKLLAEQSKDLEVAGWWIEALVREHGFAGLRDGFKLIHGWVERYWDVLHPLPDEDGVSTRVAPLTGLNGDDAEGTLIAPISLVPLTGTIENAGPFSSWHYHQASALERIEDADQRQQRIAAGTPTLEQFRSAARNGGATSFREVSEDLDACRAAFNALNAALEQRCGHFAPPSTRIADALARVAEVLSYVAREVVPDAPAAEASPASAATASNAPSAAAAAPGGPLRSREDALRTLKAVAEYYRRAEPHSPIAYLVEQAVRWGNLPLHELIEELIPDAGSRSTYQMMTGIRPPPTEQ
jgi:type VI secretion system protein ImpA